MFLTRERVVGGRTRNSTAMACAIFSDRVLGEREAEGRAILFKTQRFVSLPYIYSSCLYLQNAASKYPKWVPLIS